MIADQLPGHLKRMPAEHARASANTKVAKKLMGAENSDNEDLYDLSGM